MLKNPEDRRARRTRRLLKESLLELMEQKHFSEISVRDVTDNADMNRTTFYLHYTDTTQLLQSMEEDLLAEAQVLVDAHMIHRNGTEVIRAWFQPMDDQQLSYLLRFITYGLIGLIREWFQKNMDLPKEELLVTAEFLVDGATSRLLKDA